MFDGNHVETDTGRLHIVVSQVAPTERHRLAGIFSEVDTLVAPVFVILVGEDCELLPSAVDVDFEECSIDSVVGGCCVFNQTGFVGFKFNRHTVAPVEADFEGLVGGKLEVGRRERRLSFGSVARSRHTVFAVESINAVVAPASALVFRNRPAERRTHFAFEAFSVGERRNSLVGERSERPSSRFGSSPYRVVWLNAPEVFSSVGESVDDVRSGSAQIHAVDEVGRFIVGTNEEAISFGKLSLRPLQLHVAVEHIDSAVGRSDASSSHGHAAGTVEFREHDAVEVEERQFGSLFTSAE